MRLLHALAALGLVLPMACTTNYIVQPNHAHEEAGEVPTLTPEQKAIPVYTTKSLGRPCEVVGVLDMHTNAESEDKGFDELRYRASALGADAVIGAEFEHGDNGEPSHLSGMAVKFAKPTPEYDVLGEIDIPSEPNSTDKGVAEMARRARQMGADLIVDVEFEHGDNGALGHLKGKAVRFRK